MRCSRMRGVCLGPGPVRSFPQVWCDVLFVKVCVCVAVNNLSSRHIQKMELEFYPPHTHTHTLPTPPDLEHTPGEGSGCSYPSVQYSVFICLLV